MTTTANNNKVVEWDDLLESIATGPAHVNETKWKIYYYLKCNYKEVDSVMVRTLLSAYIKLHRKEASLVNSCMLGLALKISEEYSDFKLPRFLEAWGYDSCLRAEDRKRTTGRDGRQYLSLKERVERAVQLYLLHHPEEQGSECNDIVRMYAVKVFEKEDNGKKHSYVKLVAPNGSELIADSHQFPCRPWEICGKMFDVLTRVSKHGHERAVEIVSSCKRVDEVFSVLVGYVDFIDEKHGHIHVFDPLSRHFVADKAAHGALKIPAGSFVRFCPIIINGDHFKSAAVLSLMDKDEGRAAFGLYTAKVDYVNVEEQYIRYSIESPIPETPEGTITKEGFASTSSMTDEERHSIVVGKKVHLLLFLKRWKDGAKHNHVAEILPVN